MMAGMSIVSEWHPDRPYCLPGCNRLDGHDGRDAGACMGPGGNALWGVYTYDGPLGFPPDTVVVYGGAPFPETVTPSWTPFRDRIPRATRCYRLASGAMVHVKPECRCKPLR
jgi:hypothetical protein